MYYITADPHGRFKEIRQFAQKNKLTSDDTIVVLGDAGVNYYLNHRDDDPRREIAKIKATIFCIHGNHEARPESLRNLYREIEWRGGIAFVEDAVPNLIFGKDGEIYDFDGASVLVLGGAYSVDKYYRLAQGWSWFNDEQPSEESKRRAIENLNECGWAVDIVLSHTCPYSYEPREAFLEGVDQSKVDKTTEHWLDIIEENLYYKRWYCGHWHISKKVDRLRFMFHEIEPLPLDDAHTEKPSADAKPRILYTSDLHLGHRNIIHFCNRPFADVEDMNETLIRNWNAKVRDCDEVYIVGDFMYRSATPASEVLTKLAGKKHLVIGNHDDKWMKSIKLSDHFESVSRMTEITDEGRYVVMCHYPLMTWPRRAFHVYGHIHNNKSDSYWPLLSTYQSALNAGVEVNNYAPATLDELIANNEIWKENR